MARSRYLITVWYLTREHMLGGVPAASSGARRLPRERTWTFIASGPPPPEEREALWSVRYRPNRGSPVVVTLDMRFVKDVESLSRPSS
jgi:hypothetical protein